MTDLILSLDVISRPEAIRIASDCVEYVDAIKIGYPLVLGAGIRIAEELELLGKPLIADFKVADIPNTNRLICEQVFSSGFSAVIAHAFPGRDSASVCVDVAHDHGGECYIVTEMSHPGATEFFHGGNAEKMAAIAVETCADGIIAPATRTERINALRGIVGSLKILSPGVGAQGADPAVVAPLVDGIIVGRSIYESERPDLAAEQFLIHCR